MSTAEENPIKRASLPAPPVELAPPDYCDPVVEAYKKDVDRTLLRENLKLTVEQRLLKAQSFHEAIAELQALLEERRKQDPSS